MGWWVGGLVGAPAPVSVIAQSQLPSCVLVGFTAADWPPLEKQHGGLQPLCQCHATALLLLCYDLLQPLLCTQLRQFSCSAHCHHMAVINRVGSGCSSKGSGEDFEVYNLAHFTFTKTLSSTITHPTQHYYVPNKV